MDETEQLDFMAQTGVAEDFLWDYLHERKVKRTAKEEVRQRIVRALFHEYGLSVDDMELDFPIAIQDDEGRSRRRRADIAIFTHGAAHELASLRRVVICAPEPRNGKTVTRLRDYAQAER